MSTIHHTSRRAILLQLSICVLQLFALPLIPAVYQKNAYHVVYLLLLAVSSYVIKHNSIHYFRTSILLIVLRVISAIIHWDIFVIIVDLVTLAYFMLLSVVIISQLMRSKLSPTMLFEAISGYLLLGIALTMILTLILHFNPDCFIYQNKPLGLEPASRAIQSYFIWITYTTVGYGDVLPNSVLGMTYAKFVAISGQLYISIVISLLIGRYLNRTSDK